MKITAITAVVAMLFAGTVTTASAQEEVNTPDPEVAKRHQEIIYPVVQVQQRGGSGSGTLIFSGEIDGEIHTYVLTNNHVIAGAIKRKEEWDAKTQSRVDVETREPVKVAQWEYNDLSRVTGTKGRSAQVVAYDERLDLALVRLDDRERVVAPVAIVAAVSDALYMTDEVWAVGGGLGHPPFPAPGNVEFLDSMYKGQRYIMASAPIIFGNSGGALFKRYHDGYHLVGVPAMVAITGNMFSVNPVTHMGFSIPIETVRGFLAEWCYSPIVGSENGDHCSGLGEPSDG